MGDWKILQLCFGLLFDKVLVCKWMHVAIVDVHIEEWESSASSVLSFGWYSLFGRLGSRKAFIIVFPITYKVLRKIKS